MRSFRLCLKKLTKIHATAGALMMLTRVAILPITNRRNVFPRLNKVQGVLGLEMLLKAI